MYISESSLSRLMVKANGKRQIKVTDKQKAKITSDIRKALA